MHALPHNVVSAAGAKARQCWACITEHHPQDKSWLIASTESPCCGSALVCTYGLTGTPC